MIKENLDGKVNSGYARSVEQKFTEKSKGVVNMTKTKQELLEYLKEREQRYKKVVEGNCEFKDYDYYCGLLCATQNFIGRVKELKE